MKDVLGFLTETAEGFETRHDFWQAFLGAIEVKSLAEIGVLKGDFAQRMLRAVVSIEKYYMIDPWRNLDDWNKPANKSDDVFERYLSEAMEKTEFASEKRVILRGKTTEVIHEIEDSTLDYAYIDGDHTLKGISIDLVNVYAKIRNDGWIGGDDFTPTVWQHSPRFDPTFVFPFAVYFAEATANPIYGLPHNQFLIQKLDGDAFKFVDLTGRYKSLSLLQQCRPSTVQWVRSTVKQTAKRVRNKLFS